MKSKQSNNGQQELLSGWKDIARHLGKGVRTVQRYERELGLPVRRPSGNRSGSVVATKPDLDSWLRSSATGQESLIRNTVTIQAYLSSEMAKGRRDRADLQAQMRELRKELETSVRRLRKSILNLRQHLKENRKLLDSIASEITRHSKVRDLLSSHVKHEKPN